MAEFFGSGGVHAGTLIILFAGDVWNFDLKSETHIRPLLARQTNMTICAALAFAAASPYTATTMITPHSPVIVTGKIIGTAPRYKDQKVTFINRKTQAEIPFDVAFNRLGDLLNSYNLIASPAIQKQLGIADFPGTTSNFIAAVSGDVKVGHLRVTNPVLAQEALFGLENRTIGLTTGATVPCAWIGAENRLVILPLADPNKPFREVSRIAEAGDYAALSTAALATDGKSAVGAMTSATEKRSHAIYWRLGGRGAIDLNPEWATSSVARAVNGNFAVGLARKNGVESAMLWNIDSRWSLSLREDANAIGVRGNVQIGYTGVQHLTARRACLWKGTAKSYIDLHALLPDSISSSQASWIDKEGVIYGFGLDKDGRHVAIEWKPTENID